MDESHNLEPAIRVRPKRSTNFRRHSPKTFEVRRKSPFFKTITGVVFVSIVGFSLYTKFRGLTSISWPKIILGTLGIGIFLRYVVYQYSPFNIKPLARTNNLKNAKELKIKYDRKANMRDIEQLDFVPIIDVLHSLQHHINILGIYKCDIYDVGNKWYITNESPKIDDNIVSSIAQSAFVSNLGAESSRKDRVTKQKQDYFRLE